MNLFSTSWWMSTITSTLITMCMIALIKYTVRKFNIPVLSTVVEQV